MPGSLAGQVWLPQVVFAAAAVACHPIASKLWVWCVYVAEKLVGFVITSGDGTSGCWSGNCQSKGSVCLVVVVPCCQVSRKSSEEHS